MAGIKHFEVVVVIGNRTGNIPYTWVVFNAPRPLHGDITWEDTQGPCGWFHAAVNPNGEFATHFIESNKRLDAHVLEYASYATLKSIVMGYAASKRKEYADRSLDSVTYEVWESTYLMQDDHPRIYFTVEGMKERKECANVV